MRMLLTLPLVGVLVGCTPTETLPIDDYEEVKPSAIMTAPADATGAGDGRVEHGRYLVELLGCGTCHTDGALVGEPRMDRWLAGSRIGIAYSNPLEYARPGIVFGSNLTPDRDTGIGNWSDAEVAAKIRAGVGRHGRAPAPVMPSGAYFKLSDEDVGAIVAYLRSLPTVEHAVPAHVPPGAMTRERYVHFGVYRSKP